MAKMFGVPKLTAADVGDGGGDDDAGLKGAAKDILEAIKDNDVDALAMALKLAHQACSDDYEGDDDEDSGE